MSTAKSNEDRWVKAAQNLLVGRKIVAAGYLTKEEADRLGWRARSVVFELDNGVLIWPSMDDEGNDAGALFTTDTSRDTLPVLRW